MNKVKMVVMNNYLLDNEKVVNADLSFVQWYVFNCINNLTNFNIGRGFTYGFAGTIETLKEYLDFPENCDFDVVCILQSLIDKGMIWAKYNEGSGVYYFGSNFIQDVQQERNRVQLRGVEIE